MDNIKVGFAYHYEHRDRDGNLVESWTTRNLIPDVGRDYFIAAGLSGGSQYATWYGGIYAANRTPVADDTMTTFIADCSEVAAYSGATRPLLTMVNNDGVWSNVASKTVYTFTSAVTVWGGFIASHNAKGGTSGILLSAAKEPSAKTFSSGETLTATYALTFTTV